LFNNNLEDYHSEEDSDYYPEDSDDQSGITIESSDSESNSGESEQEQDEENLSIKEKFMNFMEVMKNLIYLSDELNDLSEKIEKSKNNWEKECL
jgi:hypothetical protein